MGQAHKKGGGGHRTTAALGAIAAQHSRGVRTEDTLATVGIKII